MLNVRMDISNIRLETKRLILRAFEENDLEDFYAYAKEEGVGEMAGWSHHKSIEESKQILNLFIKERKTFAIVDKINQRVIGSLGLEKYNEGLYKDYEQKRGLEVGYVLSKEYWGKGLMPEAVERVIQFLFEEEHLDFITCAHFLSNLQSKKVIEKCGFQFLSNGIYDGLTGSFLDANYILRKEEYQNGKF